jgi:glycerol uptake facilitator-like aquaporin
VAGTALLVGIGTGAIVAGANAGGVGLWLIAVAWFIAVAVPVFVFARFSGSHINPAVTLALALSGRFPRREVLPYGCSQVAGAFVGSFIVLLVLGPAAHLGATLPRGGNLWLIVPLEVPFTLFLMLTVLYLTAPGRVVRPVELFLPALAVGISTYVIGPWTGSSLNPARTLAPGVLSGDVTGILLYFLAAFGGAVAAVFVSRLSPVFGDTSGREHRPG